MPETLRRRGRTYKAPAPKCKHCDKAPRLASRPDGLCRSCGTLKDTSHKIAQTKGA